jgi:hypothetical protein
MTLQIPPAMPENLAQVHQSALALFQWIAEQMHDLEISSDNTTKVPGALFDLTIEYHAGIVHLVDGRINGSAFSLLRIAFEALIRGAWLQLCATPDELDNFVKKDRLPSDLDFGDMVTAIEAHENFPDQALSNLKHNSWKAMNGYTHGGMHQVSRRFNGNDIEPTYAPEEIIEVLLAAGTFALMALLQIARLAKNENLVRDINQKLDTGI